MGGGEGDEVEERPVRAGACVLAEAIDRVVGDGDGVVVAAAGGRRGHAFAVDRVACAAEVVAPVVDEEGAVEAAGQRVAVDVPLAAVVAAVAGGLEEVRQQAGPALARAADAAGQGGQGVAVDLLGMVAGEQGAARGPAAGGVVEAGEAEPVGGEAVEVRGCDLAAVAAEVGVAEVVGEDEQDAGACRGSVGLAVGERGEPQDGKQGGCVVHGGGNEKLKSWNAGMLRSWNAGMPGCGRGRFAGSAPLCGTRRRLTLQRGFGVDCFSPFAPAGHSPQGDGWRRRFVGAMAGAPRKAPSTLAGSLCRRSPKLW